MKDVFDEIMEETGLADKWEARGRAEGRTEGIAEGRTEGRAEEAFNIAKPG